MNPAEAVDSAKAAIDEAAAEGVSVEIKDRLGKSHMLQVTVGTCLMNVARDEGGLDISAICGGCCACGTCHVYIEPQWLGVLQEPSELEMAVLESSLHVQSNSRLACQIELTEDLNGLCLTLAPED